MHIANTRPMLQIQTKQILIVVMFSVLLLSLSVSDGRGQQAHAFSFNSTGMVNYGGNKPWWGITVSDTEWGANFFSEHHINLTRNAGGNCYRIQLDYAPWYRSDTVDVPGFQGSYRDYIKQIVDWCQPDIKVVCGLDLDSVNHVADDSKVLMMRNQGTGYQYWIDWGLEVINYCHPDGLLIIDEPAGYSQMEDYGFTYEEYEVFVLACIKAWRAVDPNLWIFLYDVPYHRFDNFGTNNGHLPYDNLVYCISRVLYEGGGFGQEPTGKTALYNDLDWRIQDLKTLCREGGPYNPRIYLQAGVATHLADWQTVCNNWEYVMKNIYDYCLSNRISCFQYTYGLWKWTILTEDYSQFNEVGQAWADYSTQYIKS